MKLAVLTPYPPAGEEPRGGVETAASRLIPALERRGVDVTVIPVHASARFSQVRNLRPMRKRLAATMSAGDFDLIHALGIVPAGFAATHAEGLTIPKVMTAHGSRRQDTLAAYHGPAGKARWLLGKRMLRSAVEQADAVIGVHPDWRVNLPIEPARFVYIPNIVDERFFTLASRPVERRVLYCGGSSSIKGWDLLVAAWPLVVERVPDARLLAVGCAPADVPPGIRASVETSPWLASAALADAMAEAALVVIPSRFEVAPTVLSEAWAARVPVVATAVGGVPTLAQGAAHLVEEQNPAALAAALVRALEKPEPGLVDEGGRRAQLHREDAVVDAHLGVYRSLSAA
jgi:glycosyltransferase involved in cell wall biosynthesis